LTDDRTSDRREEDRTLADQVAELVSLSEGLGDNQTMKERIVQHEKMVEQFPQMQADLTELGDAVLGTRVSDFQGGGRMDDGLTHDVADIRRNVTGGGLSQADKWRLWVATAASILSFAGVIAAAVILTQ
jgi:hypothetical protein